jgi:dipeptidyl aminopeptidase/acylaminoacyl peptidase
VSPRRTLPLLALLALLLSAGSAQAALPGSNGQIAYVKSNAGNDIYTTGGGRLTTSPGNDRQPAWSPDGLKIAFTSDRDGNDNIYVINPDGTGEVRITSVTANDSEPAWSPDGSKIVFVTNRDGNNEIYTMNADGTGATRLTTDADSEQEPAWSPDGSKIAFDKDVSGNRRVYVMNANGSGAVALTSGGAEGGPVWSPDGSKIAYTAVVAGGDPFHPNFDVFTMNADGSNQTPLGDSPNEGAVAWSPDGSSLTFVVADYLVSGSKFVVVASTAPHSAFGLIDSSAASSPDSAAPPDWQPVVSNYARPQGATPMRVSLVPAFKSCTSPNTSHQGPLSGSSCVPAVQASDWLTVGTPDANGAAAKSSGSVVLSVILGNPSTPADEADLKITATVKDVRQKANLADYTGQLELLSSLRITDKRNGPGSNFALPGTVVDATFGMTVGCAATADTTVGSTCSVTTTADALLSNSFKEGKRAIWRFGQMQLFDGGADGVASTHPNTLFETDGVFVP